MATKLQRRWRQQMRRHRKQESVELNVTAMLDMAFQLLAFFILTFEPSPIESQISLRMPPPDQAATQNAGTDQPTDTQPSVDLPLPISIFATAEGDIEKITLGSSTEIPGGTPAQIQAALGKELTDLFKEVSFDGIKLQVAKNLHCERLMQVVDVCMKQKLQSGEMLTKINFFPLP